MNAAFEKIIRLDKKSLKRVLKTADLFSVGYGDVGSSIYYALGVTALYALGATPIALLIAGCAFICTGLTYAELASTFPKPGGSATFMRQATNDLVSFVAGWGLLLDYIVTVAISSFAIPPYLNYFLQYLKIPTATGNLAHCLIASGIILLLFFINFFGTKLSGRFSLILAIFTIASQLGIVLMGALLFLNLPLVWNQLQIGLNESWSPSWLDFFKGCAMAMVAYTGIEAIAQLAAETKKPATSIPRAIKWTCFTVIFLYLSISMVGLSVIHPKELGTTYLEDPVGGIVASFPIGGEVLGPWVGLIAAVILLIAANAGLIGCSRLTFSMGEYYQVPSFCYQIHPKFRTPYVSLALFTILSCAVILASQGQMLFLANLYNFGSQIAFFSVHLGLILLRIKQPKLKRPYKAPLNIPIGKGRSIPLTAIFGALTSFIVWWVVVITKPEGRDLGLIWMGLGLLMYVFYRKKSKISATAQSEIEKIKIPDYKQTPPKNILVLLRAKAGPDAFQLACQLTKLHQSKLRALYILEVPESLPLDASLSKREELATIALKQAEAISREFHIHPEYEAVRARSIETTLLDLSKEVDLIVLGTKKEEIKGPHVFAAQVEKVLKKASCQVLLCKS